jgi:superoxide dismutase
MTFELPKLAFNSDGYIKAFWEDIDWDLIENRYK